MVMLLWQRLDDDLGRCFFIIFLSNFWDGLDFGITIFFFCVSIGGVLQFCLGRGLFIDGCLSLVIRFCVGLPTSFVMKLWAHPLRTTAGG
jgi:hypothetical protein